MKSVLKLASLALVSGVCCIAASTAVAQSAGRPVPVSDAARVLTENAAAMRRYDGQKVIRATLADQRQVLAASALAEDVWTHGIGVGRVDLQVRADRLKNFDELGIRYEVMIEDLQGAIEAERADIIARASQRDLSWFQNYKTRTEINQYLDVLAAQAPQIAVVETIPGPATFGGRTKRAIRITGPDAPGNPKATRPAVLFNGCQHAREWVSPMTIMYFADQLIERYPTDARVRALVDNLEIILVPVVNPDGYEYSWSTERLWRKNRKPNGDGSFGVDPNRNWGFGWGGEGASTTPSNDTYRGPSAFSEVETSNLSNYIIANPRIDAYIDFHSYSQLILSPWGYTSTLPVDNAVFTNLNARMVQAIQSVFGLTYTAGPTYTTIYPASGGSNDWAYGARGIWGFAFELRDTGQNGFLLPASQIIPTGQENFQAILALGEYVAFPISLSWDGGVAPSALVADSSNTVRVNIQNNSGTLSPGTARLRYRVGSSGSFQSVNLSLVSGTLYSASIPAIGCGQTVEFYAEATSNTGKTLFLPAGGANEPVSADSLTTLVTYDDACESAAGWSVSVPDDNATTGRWENADPAATGFQPGDDRSPVGTRCFVTDGRAQPGNDGAFDVDGGKTTLTSPAFDATGGFDFIDRSATVSYWRTYGVNGADTMPVQISGDNGATWTQLEAVSGNQVSWTRRTFTIGSFTPATGAMRLRFVARDDAPASLVEAAVDDVRVEVRGCPRNLADIDGDGVVDLADFFAFLNCFDASEPCADVDGEPGVDLGDFFLFLNAFDTAG